MAIQKQTIKAKVLKAEIQPDGQVEIKVQLADEKGYKWEKTYGYYTTEKIDLESFKKRIKEDVKKDLKFSDQLTEIKPIIGKEFPISI